MTSRQRLLSYFVRPDVLFILLILGILGLYAEFTHTGMVFPGVIGGIALLLALYGMRVLPVNAVGVLLIALAVLLFILEAKYTSHGVLGIGGVVAMLLGALMLVRSPLTGGGVSLDRKSTRLNSSHGSISYAVFCLKKKKLTDRVSGS